MVPIHYEQEDPLQEEKEQDTQSGNLMAQGMNGVRSRLQSHPPTPPSCSPLPNSNLKGALKGVSRSWRKVQFQKL